MNAKPFMFASFAIRNWCSCSFAFIKLGWSRMSGFLRTGYYARGTVFTIRSWTVLFIILLQVMNKEHGSLRVREAIMILVALNAQYCIAPRQVPPRVYIWVPGETTGFFRLILFSLCLSLNRFLLLSTPDISGHAVVGIISKN